MVMSCSDAFFEQYPSNNITEANFYKTPDDFNQAVVACYYKLKTQSGYHINELAYRSDENTLLSMAVSTQDRYDLDHFAENANNGILLDVWNAWYNGIYRCNDVLDHLEGKEFAKADQYRGEALFIRSWFYFNLYRTFGVVPITTKVVSPAAAKLIPRCTEEEMHTRLVTDLTEASELLPPVSGAEKARVSSIAALALLGKVELTFKNYAGAKVALELAMANTSYGLLSSPSQVFDVNNKMNREIIFALYYDKTLEGCGHGYWQAAGTSVMADIVSPTKAFKDTYEASDSRLALINTYRKVPNVQATYAMAKWDDSYDITYTTQVGNDFPHLRYADVVLMYAEALGLDGNIPEALTYLNKTRTRAGLSPLNSADVPSKEAFVDALVKERGCEFALEGQRWFDLVRLGKAIEVMTAAGYPLDENHLVMPIPQSQIEIVNNKSILWQNPGF